MYLKTMRGGTVQFTMATTSAERQGRGAAEMEREDGIMAPKGKRVE